MSEIRAVLSCSSPTRPRAVSDATTQSSAAPGAVPACPSTRASHSSSSRPRPAAAPAASPPAPVVQQVGERVLAVGRLQRPTPALARPPAPPPPPAARPAPPRPRAPPRSQTNARSVSLSNVEGCRQLRRAAPRRRRRVVELVRQAGGQRAESGQLLPLAHGRLGGLLRPARSSAAPSASPLGALRRKPRKSRRVPAQQAPLCGRPTGGHGAVSGEQVGRAGVGRRRTGGHHHLDAVDAPQPLDRAPPRARRTGRAPAPCAHVSPAASRSSVARAARRSRQASPTSSNRSTCAAASITPACPGTGARSWTDIEPSPTAAATRLMERWRTSPATNTPGRLVSSGQRRPLERASAAARRGPQLGRRPG